MIQEATPATPFFFAGKSQWSVGIVLKGAVPEGHDLAEFTVASALHVLHAASMPVVGCHVHHKHCIGLAPDVGRMTSVLACQSGTFSQVTAQCGGNPDIAAILLPKCGDVEATHWYRAAVRHGHFDPTVVDVPDHLQSCEDVVAALRRHSIWVRGGGSCWQWFVEGEDVDMWFSFPRHHVDVAHMTFANPAADGPVCRTVETLATLFSWLIRRRVFSPGLGHHAARSWHVEVRGTPPMDRWHTWCGGGAVCQSRPADFSDLSGVPTARVDGTLAPINRTVVRIRRRQTRTVSHGERRHHAPKRALDDIGASLFPWHCRVGG